MNEPAITKLSLHDDQYLRLINTLPNGVVIHAKGKILFVNEAALHMLGGAKAEDVVGTDLVNYVPPEFRKIVEERIRRSIELHETNPRIEERFIRRDGTQFDVGVNTLPITIDGQDASLGSLRDITEEKQVQEKLRLSEEKYHRIFKQSYDAIFIIHFDDNVLGKFVEVSDSAIARYGFSKEEFLNMSPSDLGGPGQADDRARVERDIAEKKSLTFPMIHHAKDGHEIPVNISATVIEIDGRNYTLAIVHDMTEQEKAKKEIRANTEKLQSIFNVATEGILLIDGNGVIIEANPAASRILGATSINQIMGRPAIPVGAIVIHEDGTSYTLDELSALESIHLKRTVSGLVVGLHRPDGALFWISISTDLVIDQKGNITGIVASFSDITERHENMVKLRQTEEYLSAIIQTAINDVITIIDVKGNRKFIAGDVQRILGYDPKEILKLNIFDAIYPEDKEQTKQALVKCIADKTQTLTIHYRYLRGDGSIIALETTGYNLLDNPQVGGILLRSHNVSDEIKLKAVNKERAELERINKLMLGREMRMVELKQENEDLKERIKTL